MNREIEVRVEYAKAGVKAPREAARLHLMLLPHLEGITMRPERPLVVIVPGGGYEYCSDREAEAIAVKFLAEGVHAAVLRYSVSPNRYPVAALELAWCIQYCRSHAQEWHIQPESIFTCGFSAGGHLAGTVGVKGKDGLFARALGQEGSWRPDGQILCYPVITMGEFTHEGSRKHLLGSPEDPENQLEKIESLSLETQVTPDTPPTFLWHTGEDQAVLVENSLLFAAACRRNGVPFELHIFEKGPHGLATCQEITAREESQIVPENAMWVQLALGFLRRHAQSN